jgi:hypothetical protein
MNLLDKYKLRQAQAVSQIATQQQAATVNIRAETLAERRTDAEELAYKKVYEAWFDEPFPAAQDFDPRDACITRAWADMYDENDAPRQEGIPSFEELNLAIEEAAREFGHAMLYHDEFMIWFAHDISECELQANEVEASLEKLRPQLSDVYDVEFIINLLDAALAKPPQIPDGLVGFFAPDAPPPLRRTQLKRARKWALEEHHRYEVKPIEEPVQVTAKRSGFKQAKSELTLNDCLVAARYSREQLDKLLLHIGLVEKLPSGQVWAVPTQKAWQWAAVRAALESQFLLQHVSNACAASIFTNAYGAEVKLSTMRNRSELDGNSAKTPQDKYFMNIISLLQKSADHL